MDLLRQYPYSGFKVPLFFLLRAPAPLVGSILQCPPHANVD